MSSAATRGGSKSKAAKRDGAAEERRLRLIGAMIEAVSRSGYAKVSVSEVVAIAGVSKSAFYEYFADKEGCFLASLDEVVALALTQTASAFRSRENLREGLEAAIEAITESAEEHVAAARLVTVDSVDLGRGAAPARERVVTLVEERVRLQFGAVSAPSPLSDLEMRAIVGGMRAVHYRALRDRDPGRIRPHIAELAGWALGYRRTAAGDPPSLGERLIAVERARPASEAGAEEDGGRPGWDEPPNSPRSRAALSQRERIVRAAGRLTVRNGFAALSIAAISAESGTSNQTFYELFAGKEEVCLAAFDALAERALAASRRAVAARDSWLEGAAAATLALLEALAAEPLLRELACIELPAIGRAAIEHGQEKFAPFTAFLEADPAPPPARATPAPVVVTALRGGIWAIVEREVVAGRGESLPELAPQVLEIALRPFELDLAGAPATSRGTR